MQFHAFANISIYTTILKLYSKAMQINGKKNI